MPKVELVKTPEKCSGCGACAVVCARKAIVMQASEDGSQYPVICEEKCTQCGRCVSLCEELQAAHAHQPLEAYAAVGCCEELVSKSASGGIFASLAHGHFENGGMVAAAVMETEKGLQVYHLLSNRAEDLAAMQGSKYVQSDAWKCYRNVLDALAQGKQVLFCGTPCQTAAIQKLSCDPDNLITIDLVCHGVPSMQMLSEYLSILGRRFRGSVQQFVFRNKSCKKNFCARIELFRRGRIKRFLISSNMLSYYRFFLKGIIYRESCYACPYAKTERVSDLTIGDYWGVNEKHQADFESGRMEKRNDWSFLLVNTEKGKAFLSKHEQTLKLIPSQTKWIAENNQQMNTPAQKPKEREQILRLYRSGGYEAVEKDFIRSSGGTLRYGWRVLKNMYTNHKRANGAK